MRIEELIQSLDPIDVQGNLNVEVRDITDDSRRVKQGSLFVAVKGEHVNGHAFTDQARANGAVGVVVEDVGTQTDCMHFDTQEKQGFQHPIIRVKNSREALGILASRLYADPSHSLAMIGVTGTNGKTTTTHLIKALLESCQEKVGVVGTVGYFIESKQFPASHTTPGSVELQSLLQKMVASGVDTAILEVSSHALALDRVAGCEFDTVVFTNLTQDHLDFHRNMEEYFQAKLRLFTDFVRGTRKQHPKRAIINLDDERGHQIVQKSHIPVWTYSIQAKSDIQAKDVELSLEETRFRARTPKGDLTIRSSLVGQYNVYNLLAAVGVGLELDMDSSGIETALSLVKNVPGRFERVEQGQDFSVIVDYAHTEDALERLLEAANALRKGRILTVFGCGGDRDAGKRPKMGQAAVRKSDLVILTSDNPRTEDPLSILQDIVSGIHEMQEEIRSSYRVVPDRSDAICMAIKEARSGDMVLIAGKGHEDYQIIGDRRLDFDDREVAKNAILELRNPRLRK